MGLPTAELNVNTLVSIVLAMQFAAFGWRINREIPVGDAGRRTWFPIPDFINVSSMLSVVWFCVVEPLATGRFSTSSRVTLASAFVLLSFHPISMIGHYRLLSARGRAVYKDRGEVDYPYCTKQELVSVAFGLLLALIVGFHVASPC
jgi:hypothetical protein